MKKILIVLLLLYPLLVFSQNEIEQKRWIVQNYAESILNTETKQLNSLRSLLKITKRIPEEEGGDGVIETILLFVKESLHNKPYRILTYNEVIKEINDGKLRRIDNITNSDKVLVKIPVVVNDNYEIIAISIGFCGVRDFCIKYLSDN